MEIRKEEGGRSRRRRKDMLFLSIDFGTSAVKLLLKSELITQTDNIWRVYDFFFAQWLATIY